MYNKRKNMAAKSVNSFYKGDDDVNVIPVTRNMRMKVDNPFYEWDDDDVNAMPGKSNMAMKDDNPFDENDANVMTSTGNRSKIHFNPFDEDEDDVNAISVTRSTTTKDYNPFDEDENDVYAISTTGSKVMKDYNPFDDDEDDVNDSSLGLLRKSKKIGTAAKNVNINEKANKVSVAKQMKQNSLIPKKGVFGEMKNCNKRNKSVNTVPVKADPLKYSNPSSALQKTVANARGASNAVKSEERHSGFRVASNFAQFPKFYRMDGSTPFDEDKDDVSDSEFLSYPKQRRSKYLPDSDKNTKELDQRRLQLLEEKHQIQQRTIQGTNSALGLIFESEQIGIATADDLMHQREQLLRADEKFDEISVSLQTSQKHLTAMKSVFSGVKSYFKRSKNATKHPVKADSSKDSNTALKETVDNVRANNAAESQDNHPAFRVRGINTSGFAQSSKLYSRRNVPSSFGYPQSLEKQIDSNIDQMSLGLNRLKGLARGLGDEIAEQDVILDRITGKAEKSKDCLEHQNLLMRKMARKH